MAIKSEAVFKYILQQIKVWFCIKMFQQHPIKNEYFFLFLTIISSSRRSCWHDDSCTHRDRRWEKELSKGLVDLHMSHLIFASPLLAATQQCHFHKAGMKQPIGTLTYSSYQWLIGGQKERCSSVGVSFRAHCAITLTQCYWRAILSLPYRQIAPGWYSVSVSHGKPPNKRSFLTTKEEMDEKHCSRNLVQVKACSFITKQ